MCLFTLFYSCSLLYSFPYYGIQSAMPFRIPSSICLNNPWDHLFQSQSNNKESIIHVERKLFMKLLSRKLYYVADLDSIWLPGPLHITHTLLAFVFSQGSHRNQNEKKYKIFRTCWIGPLLLYICFWSKNVAKSAPCCFFPRAPCCDLEVFVFA